MAKKSIEFVRELSFGVEIEISDINGSKVQVAQAFKNAGLKAKAISGVEHSGYNQWKVEYDGSLNGCPNGMEIVSPVLKGVQGLRELELALEVLNSLGAKVNKDCGIHVHHEASDLDLKALKNVYRLYAKHEQSIDEIFPQSRFNNRYCRLINGYFQQAWKHNMNTETTVLEAVESVNSIEEFKRVMAGQGVSGGYYREERYYKINAVAFLNHGTLEFRQHAGSTDYEKISNWIVLTHKILEVATQKDKVKPKTKARLKACEEGTVKAGKQIDGYVHRNYDLYTELGLGSTTVSEFIGKRQREFRKQGINKRGEYIIK